MNMQLQRDCACLLGKRPQSVVNYSHQIFLHILHRGIIGGISLSRYLLSVLDVDSMSWLSAQPPALKVVNKTITDVSFCADR